MLMSLLQAPVTAAYILAVAQGCTAPKPQLDFDFTVKKTAFVHTVGAAGLARMKARDGAPTPRGTMGGLTENVFSRKLEVHGREQKRADGWHCFAPVRVVAKISLEPTVYVSSAYSTSSCRFRVTREHELQHVKIAADTLEEYAPIVLARLRRAAGAAGVAGPSTAKQLKRERQRIVRKLNAVYAEALAEMDGKLAARQARLDTESEYRRIAGLCPAE